MRARDRTMRCDACGTMNKDTSRFCLYCGAALTTIGAEAAAPATAPPAPPAPVPRASPIRPLGSLLGGIAMVMLSYFLYRYSLRDMSGSFVVALEAGVIAVLLFIYVGAGLYWTTPRYRPALGGVYRTPRP